MKLASYVHDGRPTFGALVGERLVDLGGRLAGVDTLKRALVVNALPTLAATLLRENAGTPLREVTLLPPVPDCGKMLCVGVNYRAHADEGGKTVKDWPGYFIRLPETVVGHGASLEAPAVSHEYDYEGELAVIIGRGGRHIAEADAMTHVAGYTCYMDGSVRDYQKRCISAGKNFERSGAIGPWLVTADDVPDPTRLTLSTFVNGERRQHSGIDALVHSIPKTIAYLSTIIALHPGDIVATGSPAGVGRDSTPPRWLIADDVVRVEITGIGVLENRVVAR